MGAVYDITERKLLEQELREADARKNRFIATVSHELRNPLTAVMNAVAVLRKSKTDEGITEDHCDSAIQIATKQLSHLKRLIEDLIESSRIRHGNIRLQKNPCSLGSLLHEAVEMMHSHIAAKGQHISLSLPSEPLLMHADPLRIVQAFSNLIDNASKYTPRNGRIDLIVRREGNEARVILRDNGIGIPAEHLQSIFEPFLQLETQPDQLPTGLGIGLALVQELFRLHGARVEAQSEGLGQGSQFVVSLPLAMDDEEDGLTSKLTVV